LNDAAAGAVNREVFQEPLIQEWNSGFPIVIKDIGNCVEGHHANQSFAATEIKNLIRSGVVRLTPANHIKYHIGIN
jgi:hypothetical protein